MKLLRDEAAVQKLSSVEINRRRDARHLLNQLYRLFIERSSVIGRIGVVGRLNSQLANSLKNRSIGCYRGFSGADHADAIVGVASRFALSDPEFGDKIEWLLHLPARGSVFVRMSPQPVDRSRVGDLSAGTREFGSMLGQVSERWIADTSGSSGDLTGRIELSMNLLSKEQYVPDAEDAE
ncbi:MAG: hypothetical protein IIC62_04955 [Proteobacteria bacterium]|nr:hypothetical protein [Pseudomonadota bacterium]